MITLYYRALSATELNMEGDEARMLLFPVQGKARMKLETLPLPLKIEGNSGTSQGFCGSFRKKY